MHSHRRAGGLALVVLLAACGGGGGGDDTLPPQLPAPPADPPFGLTERAPLAALQLPGAEPGGDAAVEIARAFPSLSFTQPLFLAAVPGEERLVVLEKGGRMRAFVPEEGSSDAATVLNLSGRVATASEQGLLGLAFDPAFVSNRLVYLHYSLGSGPRRSVIARFTWDPGTDAVDPGSEKVILEVEQPFQNHNGGMLAFGPDDFLYIALGDGGSGGDPGDHGQNLGTLLGSLLRIDVHPSDAALPYAVPPDNPFLDTVGARPEIWAYGLRNPWRFSFDRNTGELWLADVGQNAIEEINLVVRGGNYGWRVFEGSEPFAESAHTPPGATFEAPIYEYPHSIGRSVTGGYVYRGARFPGLTGAYVFGDFVSGDVWALRREEAGDAISIDHLGNVPQLASFGEDRDGELLLVSLGGTLHRFASPDPGADPPVATTLSATGIFTDLATLTPASGLIAYDVQVPFWSDGSSKRRFFGLPEPTTMAFHPSEAWELPVGSVLVKHFEIELDDGSLRRLETRLLLHREAGWEGFSYRWDPSGADATLLAGREQESLTVTGTDGPLTFDYVYPSRTDCLRCHVPGTGSALGFETRQMNREFAFPLGVDNQLRTYDHIGLFSTGIGDPAAFDRYPAPGDHSASLAQRARAYLHVNCASCHQPQGGTNVTLDLRFDTPLAAMQAVDVVPQGGDLGIEGARIIRPGDGASSVLLERMRRLDAVRMPPLASGRIDGDGVDLIGAWIDAL